MVGSVVATAATAVAKAVGSVAATAVATVADSVVAVAMVATVAEKAVVVEMAEDSVVVEGMGQPKCSESYRKNSPDRRCRTCISLETQSL